jgi:hypothetical protein
MARILVGTATGVFDVGLDRSGDVRPVGWDPRRSEPVTALARGTTGTWAVVSDHQIWRSAGDGWTHVVTLGNLEARCVAETAAGVLVGTSSAHLSRVVGPPTPLESIASFDRVDGREGWYTPWGGPPDTRSIAEDDEAVYVNVHVGGIPRSRDGGRTWEPTIDVDADVHRVWAGDGRLLAACATGLAVSADGGDSWTIESDGLHARYCRGVTVCGDTVLLSASRGPRGGDAAVYRRPLSGGRVERCSVGLPDRLDGNVDSAWLDASTDVAAFGTTDGRVFASTDEGASWEQVASGLESISAVLVLP